MARPRLGESERRRRTIGVRVTEAEETELLGQRVRSAVERRLGAAGAGAGTGGAPLGRGNGVMVTKMSAPGRSFGGVAD